MTADRLLVPTHLSAMVLTPNADLVTPFMRGLPEYNNLKVFTPPGPAPFSEGDDPLPGVHLHWLLPRPLRHAAEARGSAFPLAPNRWAVVRIPTGDAAGQPVKAWIVVSDQISGDGASPFVDPRATGDQGPSAVLIGSAYSLDATLASLPDTGAPFLRAVGPGSATFSMYAPAVQNVLGFHDPMEGVSAGTFTYHVAGWYSTADPLEDAWWVAQGDGSWIDDTFGFTAWTGALAPPTQMLVHAFLYGVSWQTGGPNAPLPNYPTDVKTAVQVAVGNTAVDALAALVAHGHGPAKGQMLQAFQYGLLDRYDEPSSAASLDRAIRHHWFSASPGGVAWRVVATENGSPGLPAPPPAELTAVQADALDTLNVNQRALERQSRVLDSMRWALSALWWKYGWAAAMRLRPVPGIDHAWVSSQLAMHLGITPPKIAGAVPYLAQVQSQASVVAGLASTVAANCADLDAKLDAARQQRRSIPLPQYHTATDPTVLVTGLGRSTVLDPDDLATCRVATQTIPAGATAAPVLADPHALLPSGVQELHTEAYALSPPPPGAPTPPGAGVRFPPPPGAMAKWEPPWMPLFLDWKVNVLGAPAYTGADRTSPVWRLDPSQWTFDGTDYSWTGSQDPAVFDQSTTVTLSGRTFMTPYLPVALAQQLDLYVAQHRLRMDTLGAPDITGVTQQDILSQRLGGLRQLLAQRDPAPTTAPPPGPIADALGADPQRGHPRPYASESAGPVWDYAPFAGTFFTVEALTVIDHQGQAVDITYANDNPVPYVADAPEERGFYPIAASGVATPMSVAPPPPAPPQPLPDSPSERMLKLPPRLAQDSQVCFGLRSSDGTDTDVTLASRTTPVCGWIVANHLNRALAVYDANGQAQGELSVSSVGPPICNPDPTTPAAPAMNAFVAGLLDTLRTRGDDGAGLSDFLLTIDEALWTIDPGSLRSDQDLAVLVGRPLAIVRAELTLRLRGLPLTSQDWPNTFAVDPANLPPDGKVLDLAAVDGGLSTMTWPIRLGDGGLRDDGLVGYFVDDPVTPSHTWDTFMAVEAPTAATSGYVQQPGTTGTPYPTLRFLDDTMIDPRPEQSETLRLTLLVDPRAGVHAFTGLLPVATLNVPSWYTSAALRAMSYLFRMGPILTPPDELRFPRPAERHGTWSWFDRVLGVPAPIAPADDNATLPHTPARAVEGWLKLSPTPPVKPENP